MYGKTIREMREITLEAERRVRAGEPQVEVARALDIPTSTLATWARRGGWRHKDLVAVHDAERGKMILGLINELMADEHGRRQAEAAKLQEALEASKTEFEAIDPSGKLAGAMGEGPVPARKLAMALADSLLRQGRLEEADRAVRLAARFAEAEQTAGAYEEARWREERERLTKWWAEKQTVYYKLQTATEHALEQIRASMEQEVSRSADECCPKCGRRMDFWPEEVERPDDDGSDHDDSVGDNATIEFADKSGPAESGGDSGTGPDHGCHPHWKKDANGSYYWDGPPGT